MAKKILLVVIFLLPFVLYHNNTGRGPDSTIYLDVAHSIMTEGHLNILPSNLTTDKIWQVTKNKHAPIHQNIGGVLFYLPATALAFVSTRLASLIPDLPEELYNITYHEKLWVGCSAYVMALFSCLLTYQVVGCYFSRRATLLAMLFCLYGGPLFLYTAVFPCQMNLPAAFLAALLLYLFHVCDREKMTSWLLMGAVWGLGVFVRAEFVVWGSLLLYALIVSRPQGQGSWKVLAGRVMLVACGGLLFAVPGMMVRQVIFGSQGSTYGIQFDLKFLQHSYLMLIGTRNGLFTFWPVLFVAMLGYFVKIRRNSPLGHVLLAIIILECLVCGSTNFWSGEFGNSFGQRRFLVVLPCFVFFLAQLFDLARKWFYWLVPVCVASVLWALAMYGVYGQPWSFADGTMGFLMPNNYAYIFSALSACAGQLPLDILALLFLPKHADTLWLLPLVALVGVGAFYLGRSLAKRKFACGLLTLVCLSSVLTVFLAGARQRGVSAFDTIVSTNPEARFVTRNYEIDDEIVGSMVDSIAFFMEGQQDETAKYFYKKALDFLAAEAPEQVDNLKQMIEGLTLRQALGWYRLVPEQSHTALLNWYHIALLYAQRGQPPPDTRGQYLY